ncbi:MAG: ester cyclase [Proteobacteria bacterium]|nr:ester cyclase [Pseudomonadota bacterium]
MSDADKKLIAEHYAALWGGDEAALRRQIADDFVDHSMAAGAPKGVEPVISFGRSMRLIFPDMKVTLDRVVAEGDMVAVHATWRGTQRGTFQGVPATNKMLSFPGMVFWRIKNGKLAERWAMLDMMTIAQQLRS